MAQKAAKIFDVSKKTILLTGASGYLGREIAKLFATNEAQVLLLGRSTQTPRLIEEIKSQTGNKKIHGFQADLYDAKQVSKTLEEIKKQFQVDVLINNAYDMGSRTGFNTERGRLENLGFKEWQRAFESGIYWAFQLSQSMAEMMKKKGGSIINVSSMYGVVSPNPDLYEGTSFFNPATYSVMKSGLLGLTRYLASFCAKDNIRCNAVSPGPFSNTKTSSANSVSPNDPFLNRVAQRTVLKRIGKPEELDGVFLLLASDASSYITGQNFIVDGGWVIT